MIHQVGLDKEQWHRVLESVNTLSGALYRAGDEAESEALDNIYETITKQLEEGE